MNKYVIDTQALIKFLNGVKVINENIDLILRKTDEGENIIIIPSVVMFEIGYLHEKKKIPISIVDVEKIINNSINYVEEKLSINIIKSAFEITDIPELHDKLIAGTARYLNLPLITNDPVILKSSFVECVK
ncbi:MAG: PIN domain-containing protein [Candidatus Brocadiaceae bacterium]|uniref:type II toxin-antitoxin system VapC family toxin n=1 Tax=Candidatus Wunengus sp. YC61 TaxID=3367698 RepID=UPI00271F85FE|nr:PIN domain-containing protein [Candidatus Brocadiaceae bacterium]